jgi:pimeloyl-ACP methyl ester carboxylesterase
MECQLSRRTLVAALGAGAVSNVLSAPAANRDALTMTSESFHARRRFVDTEFGQIAYVEQGSGPVALFIHGVPLNGFHWRHVIAEMQDIRRCVALDLMGLGYSRISPNQDLSFVAQAKMIGQFIDAMGFDRVDLVANDSGGGIAQIFAANHPERLRSLTLTDCDTHDNWPPAIIRPSIDAARQGVLLDRYIALIDNETERYTRLSRAYADPRVLTDAVYRVYIDPLRATPESRNNFHRYWIAFDNAQTLAIEPLLRRLEVPTLVVWTLEDIFFDITWAYWLQKTIPGVVRVVEVPGAKLFFPEDRPQALTVPLRAFLGSAPPGAEGRPAGRA